MFPTFLSFNLLAISPSIYLSIYKSIYDCLSPYSGSKLVLMLIQLYFISLPDFGGWIIPISCPLRVYGMIPHVYLVYLSFNLSILLSILLSIIPPFLYSCLSFSVSAFMSHCSIPPPPPTYIYIVV